MAKKKARVAKKKATRKKTGKKVVRKKAGRGRGRPPGSRSSLPHGAVKSVKLMSGLPDEVMDIPEVKEAVETMVEIMRGKHMNRHVQTRMQAIRETIEFFAGKPKARHEHDTGPTLAEMIAKAGERE